MSARTRAAKSGKELAKALKGISETDANASEKKNENTELTAYEIEREERIRRNKAKIGVTLAHFKGIKHCLE